MKPGLYETLERIAATINERKHGDAGKPKRGRDHGAFLLRLRRRALRPT